MSSNRQEDRWFLASRRDHKTVFFELDLLLRALDRFFTLEYHPGPSGQLMDRNFYAELNAVRDVTFRVLGILEVIMPESKKNAYWFQKFAETEFLSNRSRDVLKRNLYKQDSPEKAAFLLYDLFINLKGVLTDMLKAGHISYAGFNHIGQILTKGIRENNFLNPFRKDINPDFDMIDNPSVSEVAKSIEDRAVKKYMSVLFLHLFRGLRYLNQIDITAQDPVALHSALLILILVRSEVNVIDNHLRKAEHLGDEELKTLLQVTAYQFSMEKKRVYLQELKGILGRIAPVRRRGKLENSRGILKNLIEQSIVQFVQYFRPRVQGKEIFETFTTRFHQSLTLRENVFILLRLLALLEKSTNSVEERHHIFESLKKYMRYFERVAFPLLRFDDYQEFASFFKMLLSLEGFSSNKQLEKTHNFRIFLETTLRHISDRTELNRMPIDVGKAEKILAQIL